jgi:sulfide dehydrogenase cytochrome subunit
MRKLSLVAGMAALALATRVHAETPSPQLLTISCAGCHGTGGHSGGAIPSIHGRSAASIAESLRAFRDGKQPATVMNRIAKGFTDPEIDTVSAEIAANWKN